MSAARTMSRRERRRQFVRSRAWLVIRLVALALIAAVAILLAMLAFSDAHG
ncbi:hypothetical protein [Subtercola boreus]|uniref:hypothetical protein n=1 Tax=Subtercola boreus TaxID=120213 RepID=UPI001559EFCC|nr:hypothetical protein [Subtercola boreus]